MEETQIFRDIPLAELRESSMNPRRTFDGKALADLTASVKEKGVLVPILARQIDGHFEIVAGARRFRAAKAAGLAAVPAIVREMSDEQALEAQVIENLQRADVLPIEEAEGYRRLLDRAKCDVDALAAKVGKSVSYIYQRLKLLELAPEARKALLEGAITAGHAILLARLQPKQQRDLLPAAADGSVRQLARRIELDVHLDLGKAAFLKDDAKLLKGAKACVDCPKRSGANPGLFPDIAGANVCTDPACFHAKEQAFVRIQLQAHPEAKKLSSGYYYGDQAKGITGWTPAGKRDCKYRAEGVVVQVERYAHQAETPLGSLLSVCTNNRCQVHHPELRGRREPSDASIRKQRETEKRRIEEDSLLSHAVVREAYRALSRKFSGGKLLRYAELQKLLAPVVTHFAGESYEDSFGALCDEAGVKKNKTGWGVSGTGHLKAHEQIAFLAAAFLTDGYFGRANVAPEYAAVLKIAGIDLKKIRADVVRATKDQDAEKAKQPKKAAKKGGRR